VELLSKPIEAVLEIRRKGEAGQMLSRAQWTVLAYYVQQGSEAFSKNPLSRETYIGILKAFEAAHELRAEPSDHDEDNLGNLPTDCRPERKPSDPVTPELVRKTVAETVRRLSNPATKWIPEIAARNLYTLLDDEKLPGAAALNETLSPYWAVLWRVAARGHYLVHRHPVWDGRGHCSARSSSPCLRSPRNTRGAGRSSSGFFSRCTPRPERRRTAQWRRAPDVGIPACSMTGARTSFSGTGSTAVAGIRGRAVRAA
jgi:hypothetical protein